MTVYIWVNYRKVSIKIVIYTLNTFRIIKVTIDDGPIETWRKMQGASFYWSRQLK